MKPFKIFQNIVIALFISSSLLGQSTKNTDTLMLKKEFQEQTQKWKDAYNSKDARNLVPLYSEDAQYVSSHVSGLVAQGRDKLIANFQNGMNQGGHIDSIEILTMNISCDLATLLCKYQATNNGETVIGRNLLILKKINKQWLIVLHMTVV
jgi:ketosteroid isomerase-like protein